MNSFCSSLGFEPDTFSVESNRFTNTTRPHHLINNPFLRNKSNFFFIKHYRETSLDTVKTLIAYGYIIEPPAQDLEEGVRKHTSGKKNKQKIKFYCALILFCYDNFFYSFVFDWFLIEMLRVFLKELISTFIKKFWIYCLLLLFFV